MILRPLLTAALVALPATAFAVGGDEPPTPTQTTTECPEGQIWDADANACVVIQDSRLDDDALYRAARELAYAGRYTDALTALGAMSDPADTRVQTYLGFVSRRLGDRDTAMVHYAAALAADPDNLLARSYLGMAHVEAGAPEFAHRELQEIRARGGAGSWPEAALIRAILTSVTTDY